MKKILYLLIATCISSAAFAQPTETTLSDKVKVTFPGPPSTKAAPGGVNVYTYFSKDSVIVNMAVGVDLSAMGLTPEAIAALGDDIFEQMKAPMIAQIPGASLNKSELTTFKGKRAMFLDLNIAGEGGAKSRKSFLYLFFTGATVYTITYMSSADGAKVEDGKTFFDSVVVTD